ncbi:MAG: hypothetical protein AAGJ08_00060 [Cyanobacteria bacterium P01_H01_bin.35]
MNLDTVVNFDASGNRPTLSIHVDISLATNTANWLLKQGADIDNIPQQIKEEMLEDLEQRWSQVSDHNKSLRKYKESYNKQREKCNYTFKLEDLWVVHYASPKYPEEIRYATLVVNNPSKELIAIVSEKYEVYKSDGYELAPTFGTKIRDSIERCEKVIDQFDDCIDF